MNLRALALLMVTTFALTACGAAKKAVTRAEKDVKDTPDKVDDRGKEVKDATSDAEDGVEAEAEVDP